MMRKFAQFLLAGILLTSMVGVMLSVPPVSPMARAENQSVVPVPSHETEFETRTLTIKTRQGEFEFKVEIADEPGERQKGLMFRETMPAKSGMLFDFGETRRIQMWMRNTPLSLDMIFILPNGIVAHIAERTTPFSDAIVDSTVPISHVLEVNAGISKLIGLQVGDKVELR